MATTQLSICNRALSKLGQQPIASLDDNSKPARWLRTNYDEIRRNELRLNIWNFAVKRVKVAFLADSGGAAIPPTWGFKYQYALPTDLLRLYQVNDAYVGLDFAEYRNADDREYTIEGQYICTDYGSPINLRYVADIADASKFDVNFAEALSCKLASEGCETITQSLPKNQRADGQYTLAMRMARMAGATELPPQARPDNTWIMVRVGSGTG